MALGDWVRLLAERRPSEPGLVRCDVCGQLAAPRGNHLSLHYAGPAAQVPCLRSWPPTKAKP